MIIGWMNRLKKLLKHLNKCNLKKFIKREKYNFLEKRYVKNGDSNFKSNPDLKKFEIKQFHNFYKVGLKLPEKRSNSDDHRETEG